MRVPLPCRAPAAGRSCTTVPCGSGRSPGARSYDDGSADPFDGVPDERPPGVPADGRPEAGDVLGVPYTDRVRAGGHLDAVATLTAAVGARDPRQLRRALQRRELGPRDLVLHLQQDAARVEEFVRHVDEP